MLERGGSGRGELCRQRENRGYEVGATEWNREGSEDGAGDSGE